MKRKKTGAAAVQDPPDAVTPETELGPEAAAEETPTFADSRAPAAQAAPAEEVTLEPEAEAAPGAKEPGKPEKKGAEATADKGVKPKDTPEKEKANLQAALREARGRNRSLMEEIADEKRRREEAERRAKDADDKKTRDARSKERLAKLGDTTTIEEALPIIKDEIKDEVAAEFQGAIARSRTQLIRFSQKLARRDHADFDKVLKDSGVEAMIPGEDAYALATEILESRGERPAAEKSDDAVVIDNPPAANGRPVPTVRRPANLRELPAAGPAQRRTLTYKQIDEMSDAEYEKLPEHVKEVYLAGKEG
ncbi:MAG: hypothetical protein AUG09_03475 [Acidobacteria bacterium 13_1_20CM_2_68_7]|nr:MAG: hypothetical protein AUG09_03475 [Acidobacteria bacterium 13_1_20CM_2_68_7]